MLYKQKEILENLQDKTDCYGKMMNCVNYLVITFWASSQGSAKMKYLDFSFSIVKKKKRG